MWRTPEPPGPAHGRRRFNFPRQLHGGEFSIFSRSKRIRSRSYSQADDRHTRGRYHHALLEGLEARTLLAANPIGSADVFTATSIAGWAFDADAGATAIKVRITIDGTSTDINADQTRNDLIAAVGSANHGFSFAPNLGPGSHAVTVAAIDPTTNV
jgi:hypothetical protein